MTPTVAMIWLAALVGLIWAAWWTRAKMREEARYDAKRVAVQAMIEAMQPMTCGVCQRPNGALVAVALADGHTVACQQCAAILRPVSSGDR
jgi:hypothetical protein